jgi:hypothetical protein
VGLEAMEGITRLPSLVILAILLPLTVLSMHYGMSDNQQCCRFIFCVDRFHGKENQILVYPLFDIGPFYSVGCSISDATKNGHALACLTEQNRYNNLWTPFITSALGIIFFFSLSDNFSRGLPLHDWLEPIGDNSVDIMAAHLAIFQFLNILFCVSNGVPVSFVMSGPALVFNWPVTWPLFVACGIAIPVLAADGWRKVRECGS